MIRPNTVYHLSVSSHDVIEPTVLRITLNGTEESDRTFEIRKEVTLRGDGTQTLDFDVSWIVY